MEKQIPADNQNKETILPFYQWNLKENLLEKLTQQGITIPTQVQQQCLKPIMDGQDLLVQSRTGTGKTLAFALPILQRMEEGKGNVEVLIVLPTRELAIQVAETFGEMGCKTALVYGGSGYAEQFAALRSGVRVVVGTPGRILDLVLKNKLHLENCRTLILDEADEILDMGFSAELDKILETLPQERQSLLFSATMPKIMEELAAKTLKNPHRISVSHGLSAALEIRHTCYEVQHEFKNDALCNIIFVENPRQAIIFCHTKIETEEVYARFKEETFSVSILHGDMSQSERTRTINAFRRQEAQLLIATDVAARGLDLRNVTHIFNTAVPRDAETYIHRVGRTGRAGDHGVAVTLVSPREMSRFTKMLKAARIEVDVRHLPQAEEVRKRLKESLHENLCNKLAEGTDAGYRTLGEEILNYMTPLDAVNALLAQNPKAKAVLTAGYDIPLMKTKKKHGSASERTKKLAEDQSARSAKFGYAYLQLNLGRREGFEIGRIIRLLCDSTGLSKADFGKITIKPHSTFVEVAKQHAERVGNVLEGQPVANRQVRIRPITKSDFNEENQQKRGREDSFGKGRPSGRRDKAFGKPPFPSRKKDSKSIKPKRKPMEYEK